MPADFVELVRRGVRLAGSGRALANAIGVTEQNISKALHQRGYPFNALNCVRLARFIKEPDWVVLRAAGKTEFADLLEQAYGRRRVRPASPARDPLEGLTPPQRRNVMAIVRDMKRRGSAR